MGSKVTTAKRRVNGCDQLVDADHTVAVYIGIQAFRETLLSQGDIYSKDQLADRNGPITVAIPRTGRWSRSRSSTRGTGGGVGRRRRTGRGVGRRRRLSGYIPTLWTGKAVDMSKWQSRSMSWEPAATPTAPERLAKVNPRKTPKTPKSTDSGPFAGFAGSDRGRKAQEVDVDIVDGEIQAVRLTKTIIGNVWLARDAEAAETLGGDCVPVFYFDEIEKLRGRTLDELRAIAAAKVEFPSARILQ